MGVNELLCAFGFAMIFECLTPMIAPAKWKNMIRSLLDVPDCVLTWVGAAGVACGLAIVWLFQSGAVSF